MKRTHFFSACLSLSMVLVSSTSAATISVALEDFQSSGIIDYTYNGSEELTGSAGLYRLRTSDPSGPPATNLSDPEYGFCIELLQAFTSVPQVYSVGDLTTANDPVNPISGPVTAAQAELVAQLWSLHFNPDWVTAPFDDDAVNAIAFNGMLYEILLDFDDANLSSLNLGAGVFTLEGGDSFEGGIFVNKDVEIVAAAQGMIDSLSLSYTGPLANLYALTNPEYQDYLVEAIPEVGTTTLVGLGLLMFGVGARFRRRSA